jgi:hypothetical protein
VALPRRGPDSDVALERDKRLYCRIASFDTQLTMGVLSLP